jgi:hypothetical protein
MVISGLLLSGNDAFKNKAPEYTTEFQHAMEFWTLYACVYAIVETKWMVWTLTVNAVTTFLNL